MASSSQHSWDDGSTLAPKKTHAWEDDSSESGGFGSASDSEEETPAKVADELLAILLSMVMGGSLHATTFCILWFWGFRTGVQQFKKYWMGFGNRSSKYPERLTRLLGYREHKTKLYGVPVPGIRDIICITRRKRCFAIRFMRSCVTPP